MTAVRHLLAIGKTPRAAGSVAEGECRTYATAVLVGCGYDVREEQFGYSAFPGHFGTPVAGGLLAVTVGLSAAVALTSHAPSLLAGVFVAGLSATIVFAMLMLGDGVLTNPWMRRTGINVVATRSLEPRAWLVAHLDSKSQPVASAIRMAGIVMLTIALVCTAGALALTLGGRSVRTAWWVALITAGVGALPVIGSGVGNKSSGAVDNASGVAAVLAAAERLAPNLAIGVLISSAEELGLAGARAWTRTRQPTVALNCDGVDDEGSLVVMYNGSAPDDVVRAVRNSASRVAPQREVRVLRMPLGLLTDSTALTSSGWRAVTVSHGSLATLRRVHTTRDTLASLQGTAIDDVAHILLHAAEALAT